MVPPILQVMHLPALTAVQVSVYEMLYVTVSSLAITHPTSESRSQMDFIRLRLNSAGR